MGQRRCLDLDAFRLMGMFQEVSLEWDGETFNVPAEGQLKLVQIIEDALRGPGGENALTMLFKAGGPGNARLSAAYGAALRYAGAMVSDEDVFDYIDAAQSEGDHAALSVVQSGVMGLMAIVSPRGHAKWLKAVEDLELATPEKPDPATE